ncbi:hypothetical protein [Hugenholtzia roseola]|uniref:hypothetical protein n=1 Tax=Hugenholtzia roseola TaxID=1002 RepID=UPI0003FA0B08|nr:hypothetical protein [Hugenholtzia roseola]
MKDSTKDLESEGIHHAIRLLTERKNHLLEAKAISANAAEIFSLKKQIEQIESEIEELRRKLS